MRRRRRRRGCRGDGRGLAGASRICRRRAGDRERMEALLVGGVVSLGLRLGL
jgi:hypothetical protein